MHACTQARKHVRKHVLPHADTAYQNKKGGICRVTALYPLPVAEKKQESEVSIEHLSWNDLNVYCQYEWMLECLNEWLIVWKKGWWPTPMLDKRPNNADPEIPRSSTSPHIPKTSNPPHIPESSYSRRSDASAAGMLTTAAGMLTSWHTPQTHAYKLTYAIDACLQVDIHHRRMPTSWHTPQTHAYKLTYAIEYQVNYCSIKNCSIKKSSYF